jgi:hypothetical protein
MLVLDNQTQQNVLFYIDINGYLCGTVIVN